ncbi:MAG: sensor histidine kinase, partial [Eubacteriales bacterium]
IFLIAAAAYTLYALILEFLHKKKTVDRNSIRESINTLPAGVCYFSENGLIKLCNFQMYRLYRSMTQSDLQSVNELHDALLECSRTSGIIRVSGSEPVFLFPDGRAWMYSENTIEAGDGSRYTEVIFSDVTELYERKAEIEKQTKVLKEISKNIRLLSANVAAMTKEEEILSFKTNLHDRLGAGIVAARQVLLHKLPSGEMDEVIRMWKQSVEFIEHDNSSLSNNSALTELLRDAETIGVSVFLDGSLPGDKMILELFVTAMRECLTNCVRHAEGTELYIKCVKENGNFILTVTNNGKIPEHEITPGGGLTNLIRQTGYCGGKIEILSSPEFRLIITMPDRRCKI